MTHHTTSTIEIQHRRRYENVTDCYPHSYTSYRMILITISFSYRLLVSAFRMLYLLLLLNLSASLLPSTSIEQPTSGSLHCCLLIENPPGIRIINNRVTNVLHHYLVVCRWKNLISVSSFAYWNCPLPQTCLACAYTHTVDLFSLVCCSCIHC